MNVLKDLQGVCCRLITVHKFILFRWVLVKLLKCVQVWHIVVTMELLESLVSVTEQTVWAILTVLLVKECSTPSLFELISIAENASLCQLFLTVSILAFNLVALGRLNPIDAHLGLVVTLMITLNAFAIDEGSPLLTLLWLITNWFDIKGRRLELLWIHRESIELSLEGCLSTVLIGEIRSKVAVRDEDMLHRIVFWVSGFCVCLHCKSLCVCFILLARLELKIIWFRKIMLSLQIKTTSKYWIRTN